jgi:hypothetical protein
VLTAMGPATPQSNVRVACSWLAASDHALVWSSPQDKKAGSLAVWKEVIMRWLVIRSVSGSSGM